LRFTF
jgi:hypothetical protein